MQAPVRSPFATFASATNAPAPRWRRALPWVALCGLLATLISLLLWMALRYEQSRLQARVDTASATVAAVLRRTAEDDAVRLAKVAWIADDATWRTAARELLHARRILRIERRNSDLRVRESLQGAFDATPGISDSRDADDTETASACAAAQRRHGPAFSQGYAFESGSTRNVRAIDLCIAARGPKGTRSFTVASFDLAGMITDAASIEMLRRIEISVVDAEGAEITSVGEMRGAGVYVSNRVVALPGQPVQLRLDSAVRGPFLIPNLWVPLVAGLTVAVIGVLLLLARDVQRRSAAETALSEALAFRQAMEDSLTTGLRARDLTGRITYVNPAFCAMVGWPAHVLLGSASPPFWPPDLVGEYARRRDARASAGPRDESPTAGSREGFETLFQRANGQRFAVRIFEAPLRDRHGRHTGWMSTVLDISDQLRMEEIARRQEERLQAAARLATVGEMASLLSHELNQPLAAIASYANGSMKLADSRGHRADTVDLMRQGAAQIARQAERAGKVISSVHAFVRRREQGREKVRCNEILDAVAPLVRLQAGKSSVAVVIEQPREPPTVDCIRAMVEQVLLNLARNGVQAMETLEENEVAVLTLRVHTEGRRAVFTVRDSGPGIAPDVQERLFTPFFTTKPEGMGLGLSFCHTVAERHGSALSFSRRVDDEGRIGTEFHFSLPLSDPETPPEPASTDAAGVAA